MQTRQAMKEKCACEPTLKPDASDLLAIAPLIAVYFGIFAQFNT